MMAMRCVCGAIIPNSAVQYPVTPHKVDKRDALTWETHVVKCEATGVNGTVHIPNTGWNYVEQARARDRQTYRRTRGELR